MMCINPILLKNKDRQFLNGELQGEAGRKVPCGKCVPCLRKRQSEWAFRLEREAEVSSSAFFITLTYSEDKIPLIGTTPTLVKKDFQLFMKRLRKLVKTKYDDSYRLKYYACGEYGSTTHRPHYHAILFNYPTTNKMGVEIHDAWSNGLIDIGDCNIRTINYVTKYVMKRPIFDNKHNEEIQPEFSLCSKNLGTSWLKPNTVKYYRKNPQPFIIKAGGIKQPMPRYYKDKIYNDEMKEEIFLQVQEYINSKESTYKERKERKDEIIGKFNRTQNLQRKKL